MVTSIMILVTLRRIHVSRHTTVASSTFESSKSSSKINTGKSVTDTAKRNAASAKRRSQRKLYGVALKLLVSVRISRFIGR
jgi:PAB1-binding protein PBP1